MNPEKNLTHQNVIAGIVLAHTYANNSINWYLVADQVATIIEAICVMLKIGILCQLHWMNKLKAITWFICHLFWNEPNCAKMDV